MESIELEIMIASRLATRNHMFPECMIWKHSSVPGLCNVRVYMRVSADQTLY
jgi:hypothetical protein